jgi:hypothetical protein
MRARINVWLTPGERAAVWSHHAKDGRLMTRDISRAADAESAQILDGAHDEANTWSHLLYRYLEGWAEASPGIILEAIARGYRFDDPLVGLFSRWSLPTYFERLQARFACAGAIAGRDLAFSIRGPMDGPLHRGRLKFFREAPRLGLTGITFITIGQRGVIAERVAYDPNLALNVLRNASSDPA